LRQVVQLVGDLPDELMANLLVMSGTVQDSPDELLAAYRAVAGEAVAEVWHSAAIFNFRPRDKGRVTAVNIKGTQNILDFTTQVNVDQPPRFFYISTAYCAGRENNTAVPEMVPQNISDFRSIYEWSKHEAELRVQQAQRDHQLDAFILRPSIIIGTPTTQVPCDSGYYQVVTECKRLRDLAAKYSENFDGNVNTRLIGDDGIFLNLIPIDFVVNAMHQLAQTPSLNGARLKVFNVVNEQPPMVKLIHETVTNSLQMTGLEFVDRGVFETREMSNMEAIINRRIAFQAPYMHETIHFQSDCFRSLIPEDVLPTPVVDMDYLMQINDIFLSS
jgi:nucleoside-diphosphate-sugar epimerase